MTDAATCTPELLTDRHQTTRARTEALCEPLTIEDYVIQSTAEVSPPKWHLAHTTWFYETFILRHWVDDYRPFHPAFVELFNSYYESVGPQHPRPQRGMLARPTISEVMDYRRVVDDAVLQLAASTDDPELARLLEIGWQHEEQHQELLLMDIKHNFFANPLMPVYRPALAASHAEVAPLAWPRFAAGIHSIGHAGPGFAFDNESPRHREHLQAFELANRLVTNGEYREFMMAGGYEQPQWWLADGYAMAQKMGWRAPQYWVERDGDWLEFTFAGLQPLSLDAPVCHVSLYEADAFARWASARLPTEAEWEVAAVGLESGAGHFLDSGRLRPQPAELSSHLEQMLGDVWELTASPYQPYPGYRPPSGALGEYNGKFMINQVVLRGGSCLTPPGHMRTTYRNFFYPHQRWAMQGFRLARDA